MRRSVFAVGTLALAASLALAGEARAQTPVRYGVVAGLNLAGATGDVDEVFPKSLLGFQAGGAVEFGLSPNLSIRPEVVYTMKGAKDTDGDDEFRFKTSYIQVPVFVKYGFPTQGSVRPYLMAGPAVAFNMSCKLELEIGGNEESEDCEDEGLDIAGTDFAAVFGGGVDIGAFNVGVRYELGLTNIPDEDDFDGKNKVLSFVAGYTFGG